MLITDADGDSLRIVKGPCGEVLLVVNQQGNEAVVELDSRNVRRLRDALNEVLENGRGK